MTNPTVDDDLMTAERDLLTPEGAMNQVHAWTTSRVVGKHAANMLEVLGALGVHVALANNPDDISVKLAWRTPTTVEITIAWVLGTSLGREPAPYVADKISDLATSWSFHDTPAGAKLVCLVEDE